MTVFVLPEGVHDGLIQESEAGQGLEGDYYRLIVSWVVKTFRLVEGRFHQSVHGDEYADTSCILVFSSLCTAGTRHVSVFGCQRQKVGSLSSTHHSDYFVCRLIKRSSLCNSLPYIPRYSEMASSIAKADLEAQNSGITTDDNTGPSITYAGSRY
jgi:hypothetical protein